MKQLTNNVLSVNGRGFMKHSNKVNKTVKNVKYKSNDYSTHPSLSKHELCIMGIIEGKTIQVLNVVKISTVNFSNLRT